VPLDDELQLLPDTNTVLNEPFVDGLCSMRHEYPATEIGLGKHIWQPSRVVNVETRKHAMSADEH